MRQTLRLVTPPSAAAWLVTTDELKTQTQVDGTDHDANLRFCGDTAEGLLDGVAGLLGRALRTQTWELVIDQRFPCAIELPLPPCQSVTSIAYTDPAGDSQTLAPSAYRVFGLGDLRQAARILPAYGGSWPATRCEPEAVVVRFVAGYGDAAATVPAPIRKAALWWAQVMFETRGYEVRDERTRMAVPAEVSALLAPYEFNRLGR